MIDFKQAEKYILSKGLLHYQTLRITLSDNLEKLIEQLLYNSYKSLTLDEFNVIQCKMVYNRTITDIYRLCKYYYPDECSLEEVYTLLLNNIRNNNVTSWICSNIRKRTYYCVNDLVTGGRIAYNSSNDFNSEPIDEYNYDFNEFIKSLTPITNVNRTGYGTKNNSTHLTFENYLI